ncbi:Saccharopine dehydrogenase [Haematococcus lacustris]
MSLAGKKVVIIGGTGRVGSSTASCILRSFPDVNVTIAGRSKSSYDDAISRRPDLAKCRFQQVDIASPSSVKAAMSGIDLIIHAAGPFQQTKNHIVLEQAIDAKVAYVDVCDDLHYSEESKALYGKAAADAGVPAIISAGIYPGTSNVMAAHIISIAKGEYDENWQYRTPEAGQGEKPKLLRYSYYTAGSGGAGPTILQTSFLLAGEPVVVYKEGQRFELPPISNRREVDFGPGIGRKGVYLYNLPECESAYKYLGVPGVSARFGTDPFIWNWAMWLMARAMPRKLLNDRTFVKSFASLSEPAVRLVDKWAGEAVAMKIEVDFESGKNSSGIFVHRLLGQSMGYSVAGFAQAVLLGQTKPGVWYPEEKEALADRRAFIKFAATGCERLDLNRSAWSLESDPQQIGGLIYW